MSWNNFCCTELNYTLALRYLYLLHCLHLLLVLVIQLINGGLILKVNFLSYASLFESVTVIVLFTTIYTSL